jgi:hypothetical protein
MTQYNFNRSCSFFTPSRKAYFKVYIDDNSQYGYFEHSTHGDELGGGLYFECGVLVEAEGTYCLPETIADALVAMGCTVDKFRFCIGA